MWLIALKLQTHNYKTFNNEINWREKKQQHQQRMNDIHPHKKNDEE